MTKIEKKVWQKLKQVVDPELNISIVDLGLVHKVKVDKNQVQIVMTLTTIGCPLFSLIEKEVENKVKEVKEIQSVEVKLVFEPAWNMEMISEEAKEQLGLI
jgi:metal-sulfur cluster biosynthetic enzyme